MKNRMLRAMLLCAAVSLFPAACAKTGANAGEAVWNEETGQSDAEEDTEENREPEEAVPGEEGESAGEVSAQMLPAEPEEEPEPVRFQADIKVKGIYVTGAMAGTANMDQLIALVDRTELNTMVIDVKNDEGRVVYEMDSPMVSQTGSAKRLVSDMPELVRKCKEHGIYLIARIVAFRDPFLAEARTDLALHDKDGNLFRDKSGLAWVNPYRREIWDYLLEIAQEAVSIGFDEIQFDYIRFSTDKGMENVDFGPEAGEKGKEEIITEFAAYAAQRLHEANIPVSADVYGIIIDSQLDASIVGQNYYDLSCQLDYISPMVYPSHYGPGNLGLDVPDANPYDTIFRSMSTSRMVLSRSPEETDGEEGTDEGSVSGNNALEIVPAVSGNSAEERKVPAWEQNPRDMEPAEEIRADVRPWLQDFTASWVKGHISYGPEEIRAQIQAVYDAGYDEWILWNASNRYTEGGLLPAGEEEDR